MRKREILAVFIGLIAGIGSTTVAQNTTEVPSKFTGSLITGYNAGYGIQANITLDEWSTQLPFKLRLGMGYTFSNPGHAADARRIFINNATNGVPEKKGRTFDYRLDFMLPKTIFNVTHSYLVFGPRYSSFKGNFKYIGGNEDFDVTSKQWGLGGGIENHFPMAQNIDLVLAFGLDYYFNSTLKGHDTSYSPGNDNVNPRTDNQNDNQLFKYKDANKAIRQPSIMPRAMIGVSFNL